MNNDTFTFPVACFVNGWDVLFDLDTYVPQFINGQYWWQRQQEAHVYQGGCADPDPAEIEAREREEAVNPLLTALPLRRFETGTLLTSIDGVGVYAVLRRLGDEPDDEPGCGTWCFIAVTRRAVEQGAALRDEGEVWPLYTIRISDSRRRFNRDAPGAWAAIQRSVRHLAERARTREQETEGQP